MWSSDFKLIPTSYWIKLCFLIFLYYQIQKRIQKINGKGEKDKTLFFFFKAAQGLELEREKEKGEGKEKTQNDLTIPSTSFYYMLVQQGVEATSSLLETWY